ncbi:MAG: type I glutamate--ammonia ligase [Candidatus Zixiibacteriota bacterium]
MFKDIDELARYISEEDIEFLDLYYTDLFGNFRHLCTPSKNFSKLVHEGLAFDGSSVPGFHAVECGDLLLIPDPKSAFADPFHPSNVIMLCKQVDADTHEVNPADPRMIAQKAEKFLKDELDASSVWLPEFEFFLFDDVAYLNRDQESFFSVATTEYQGTTDSLGYTSRVMDGYHATPPQDANFLIRSEMVRLIENVGIPVHYHHHEVGGASQQEIEIALTPLLQACDAVQIIKYIIRMTAGEAGLSACFMPKPMFNHPGNGMHFHQMLVRDGKSLFWGKGNYADLSDMALHYIGGLLKHAPALVAITNPSTNSYKRLLPGFEAPTRLFFGLANRSAAIRVPKYANTDETKRMEFRPPDATANPYLAISAMLMAGIDGIKNKIDPTEHGFGPFDENVSEWPEEEQKKLQAIPTSLPEALDALQSDYEFLLQGNVFTEQFVEYWVKLKTDEYRLVNDRPSPAEFEIYYNV